MKNTLIYTMYFHSFVNWNVRNRKQFEAYFRTAPLWLMDLFQSEIMEAGTTLSGKMNRQIRFSLLPEEE